MKNYNVDVAVIGGGTAGLGAYRSAKTLTDKVVLIEGGPYGTTCARVGCMPSKLLIAAAESVHHIQSSPQFGLEPSEVKVNGLKVMERVRKERDRFVGFVLESVDQIPSEDRIRGYAQFKDNHTLIVDNHTEVHAKSIIIATGSSPMVLPMFQEFGNRLVVNDDIFEWETLPKSVAVFGPGIIGLELGQAMHRLGVRVVILGRGGFVGPLSDPQIREYSTQVLGEELYLDPDAQVSGLHLEGEQAVITYRGLDGQSHTEAFEYVLAATGRIPNVKNLSLENTDLQLNEKGVPLFNPYTLKCGESSIFIAGDVNNDRPLLHEAADEGRIAGANAARLSDIRAGNRRAPLSIVFTDPQIAMVGRSFLSLPEGCFATGEVSFENQGRSRVMLQNKGLLHVYAEYGTGVFLGAEMIGPRAEHWAHLLAWAYQQKMTIPQMLEMPFYHPVIEEGIRTALRDVNSKLQLGPPSVEGCLDCGPGA